MCAKSNLRSPRNRLLTPEINTYGHQMQQCQKRSANLPFQAEDEPDGLKLPSCSKFFGVSSGVQQIPRILLPIHSERRSSYQSYASRKGSFLLSRRNSKSYSPSTRNSSRKPSLGLREPGMFPSVYGESDARSGRLSSETDAKNGDVSLSIHESKTSDKLCVPGRTLQNGQNLREAKIVSAIHPQQEYLLHALTALAINSLTSGLTPREESEKRLTAVSHLSHRRTSKAQSSNEEELNQGNFFRAPVSKSASSGSFSTGTSKLDEFFAAMEDPGDNAVIEQHAGNSHLPSMMENKQICDSESVLKRSRINQLRNYLRYSGFGEPVVVVSSASKADQIRLAKLLQRMRRNDNPQRQERLRLRARLDYEMSLMRAVSFCEQQEQIYFRSASVDMENTDLQMLEDDLKYQAIQEMRRNARNMDDQDLKDHERKAGAHTSGALALDKDISDGQGNQLLSVSNRELGHSKVEHSRSPANQHVASRCNTQSGTSLGYDGDILSGMLGSPLSKQELRDRIQCWLAGVAEAMAGTNDKLPPGYDRENVAVVTMEKR